MKVRLLLLGIILLAGIFAGITWWINRSYQKNTVDSAAIWQMQFIDLQGKVQKISRPQIRLLVINFWASWCGSCREEMSELADLSKILQGQVDFIGIAVDNAAAVQQFLTTITVPYPIFLGQTEIIALMRAQGNISGGLPFTMVYTAQGHLIMAKAGKISKETFKKLLRKAINSP